MANRYWVGGTGNWDATTTNWSATSGGAGGASVPTLADDVFFDTLSNATAYVCTLTTAPVCRSVSVAGPATGNVTIASSVTWSIYGSLTIAATGVTWTMANTIFFVATTTGWTVTTNGVTLPSIVQFSGVGGGWTLGSALTAGNGVQFFNGTLTTNNFSMTTSNNFSLTGAGARTLNLGSSTINAGVWTALGATNLTLNAGTSTITVTGAAGTFNGGGLTYYNVTKANNGFAIGDANNTFNALTNTTVTADITYVCSFVGNQTIGTLTINGGTQQTRRITIQGTTPGVQVTLTVATFVTNGYIDFRDINLAGAASPLTVATGGDAGNNTNITLQTPKTVYWSLVAGGAWTATAWALTSGGAPALANYPLAQDTVIIQNTGLNSGATITFGNANIGTIDASTRTLPMTLTATGTFSVFYGDFKLSSAVTTTTGTLPFSGYNKTQTFTSAGASVLYAITVNGTSTTFALGDALTMSSTATFTLTLGTLNLVNNNLTCGLFSTNNSNTRAITFGTGQINLTGNNATIWTFNAGSGLTVTGSAIVNATYSGATGTRLFLGYAVGSAVINVNVTAGTDIITMSNNGFNNVSFAGFTGSCTNTSPFGSLTLGTGMTISSATVFTLQGSGTVTSNGVLFDAPLTINASGTYTLQDALTVGSTRTVTLTKSTFDLNAQTATMGLFSSAGSLVRSIAFNGGTMTVLGATFTASGSNLTITGSGTISMTSASSKTFAGNGLSYPTLNQGGAGTLIITGANTFANMTNTVQPCTITFPASTTTTVSNFNVNGTAGNLVTLNSSTPGTRFTLAKI